MAGKFNTTTVWAVSAMALNLAGITVSSAAGVDAAVINIAAVPGEVDTVVPAPSLPVPEELAKYADAPDGVDPLVTGPVSTAFRQRQQTANCGGATWPNIPADCFPD